MPVEMPPHWDQTSSAERTVLRMKALFGTASGKGVFLDLLRRAGGLAPEGPGWTGPVVNQLLEALKGRGLLAENLACPQPLVHVLTVEAVESPEAEPLLAALHAMFPPPTRPSWSYSRDIEEATLRWMRLAIYRNDREEYERLAESQDRNLRDVRRVPMMAFVGQAVDPAWLIARDPTFQVGILQAKVEAWQAFGQAAPNLMVLVDDYRSALRQGTAPAACWPLVCLADLLNGRLTLLAESLVAPPPLPEDGMVQALRGAHALLTARSTEAVAEFAEAQRRYRKFIRKRKAPLPGAFGWLHLVALLAADDAGLHAEVEEALQQKIEARDLPAAAAIQVWLDLARNRPDAASQLVKEMTRFLSPQHVSPFAFALLMAAGVTAAPELIGKLRLSIESLDQAVGEGLPLIGRMLAEVLERIGGRPRRLVLNKSEITLRFTALQPHKEAWERALASLESLLAPPAPVASNVAKTRRLVWMVDPDSGEVQPLEQSRQAQGWSNGRAVALKRLHARDAKLDYLDDGDQAAIRTIRRTVESGWGGRSQEIFDLPADRALPALIGHPRVFNAKSPDQPIELVSGRAELVITQDSRGFQLGLSHRADAPGVVLEVEAPTRWRVVTIDAKAVTAASILGKGGVGVPKSARDRLLGLLRNEVPGLAIRAEGEGLDDETLAAGDPRPVVRLSPVGKGVKAALVVRPLGEDGPHYLPSLGSRTVSTVIGGERRRVRRDPEAELAQARALAAACPSLGEADGFEWFLDTPDAALELLAELRAVTPSPALEWPQGAKLTLHGEASLKRLSLSVKGGADWFQLGGAVTLDDGLVLDLKDLLGRIEPGQGRFIALDDGGFLALDRTLRSHLERLSRLAHPDTLRLPQIAGVAVRDLLAEAGSLKADGKWKQFATRLDAAEQAQPQLAPGFQAELRDYQQEGFAWMARLALWGAGACLADDMGLGKTVQAIAVMARLAGEGPCLVVAPTSVCGNWESELARFAPGLVVQRLAEAGDRAALLETARAGTVVIASYGLLVREEEGLAAVSWRMAVLDEAQAIKNADSQRAKAAFALKAEFRLALSGTPVENALAEMWSLFRFLNPGLLGGQEVFQRRFATPIDRGDIQARQALKALLRPFLLRRTKAAVLPELPSRTEVTLRIEAGPEERAFYEALRQTALDKLAEDKAEPANRQRMRVLAEILRLRQACCGPSLVTPGIDLPSAKREALLELVEELRENRHRALVFSQFVGHLALVRAALDERGIAYQYLDGGTPAREREKRVAAFQAGEGELFLISLKAGGTGLNLTAADYVIHLDPWWNPAVEDQASDRAHRIGQQRPVTIYRLIVADSIEEGILALHRKKRDLADALLEGADASATLSMDDLLGLIHG